MANACIYNGVPLPSLERENWRPPQYITITHFPSDPRKYPYYIHCSNTEPYMYRSSEGALILCDSDDERAEGEVAYSEGTPYFVWSINKLVSGGLIWNSEFGGRLIWTNYDVYLGGELYMKATEPIEAAYNANAMSDSMRRFVTQHIYGRLGKNEAGALMGRYRLKPKTAFAVYSEDDNSLTFYNNPAYGGIKTAIDAGETVSYKGKTVTGLYTGFDTAEYATAANVPWADVAANVVTASFADVVSPLHTARWFQNFSSLASVDLDNLDTSRVRNMLNMFALCPAITSLDLSGFDTSAATNMSYMFYGCSALTELDISSFDTRAVTDMTAMFYQCSSLAELDVSGFDTSNVTLMNHMFYECSALTKLDVSSFDTSKVTTMASMFSYCTALTSLDLSSFDTSAVTTLTYMFRNCEALTSVDLGGFNTSKVTTLSHMMESCGALTYLDLSSFDTSAVTDMTQMFCWCNALETIYVSNLWSTAAVTASSNMFYDCTKLVGGNGTVFNSSYRSATYARIDTASTAGYLTYKDPSAEPVAYRYNGEELSVLPERDEDVYPYATILRGSSGTLCVIFTDKVWSYGTVTAADGTVYSDKFVYFIVNAGEVNTRVQHIYQSGSGVWGDAQTLTVDQSNKTTYAPQGFNQTSYTLIWANHDVMNTDDGTVYLAASAPVPVYA